MEEHINNLNQMLSLDNIKEILDCGSGRTSLTFLTQKYPDSNIDAIVYPGDDRKINSIKANVNGKYNLIEMDICKEKIDKKYDLVLAHLLLGEATKFGNKSEDMIDKLLNIDTKYILILDFLEDNSINYDYLYKTISKKGYKILDEKEFKKIEEQDFKYFIGKTYKALLVQKNFN